MSFQIFDSEPVPTEEQLAIIEEALGQPLPDNYKAFLKLHNGGSPEPDAVYFSLAGAPRQPAMIAWFFAAYDGKEENLLDYIQTYKDRIPDNMFPFGRGPGGDLFCLVLDGFRKGEVLYWISDLEGDDGDEPTFDNLATVADSFDAFLDSITTPP